MPLRATNTITSAGDTTLGIVVPVTAQTGDLATLIAATTADVTSDLNSAGWTLQGTSPITASSGRLMVWTKTVTAPDIGATVNLTTSSTARWALAVMVRSGVTGLGIAPVFNTAITATTSPSTNAVTTSTAGVELVCVYGCTVNLSTAVVSITVPATQTGIANICSTSSTLRNAAFAIGEEVLASAGNSGTRTATSANVGGVNDGRIQQGTVALAFTNNLPPTADAGPDQVVNADVMVTLDGTGSNDPDGSIASYNWQQLSGSAVTLSSATAAQPTFTAPHTGTSLVFGLVVADNNGVQSTQDTVTIAVSAPPPDVKVRMAGVWVSKPIKARVGGGWQ